MGKDRRNKRKKDKKRNKNLCVLGPLHGEERNESAFKIRYRAAQTQLKTDLVEHTCNGDESLYPTRIANFSKGLPHNELGEVDFDSYHMYLRALNSGNSDDFNDIPMGGVAKLANPQATYVFDLFGKDCHNMTIEAPPSFSSAWNASEMAELYWQALTRDIPFSEYETQPLIELGTNELSSLSDFRGPKVDGVVTTGTLFRGDTPGDLNGPYISQFLWMDIPFGAKIISQQYRTLAATSDQMTSYDKWLNVQNGGSFANPTFDPIPRYIRNGRDLSAYVQQDFSYQAPLTACLILQNFGRGAMKNSNPYLHSKTEGGFITFGSAHILDLVSKVARVALEAAWFQKFLVHRRLRPEEFGGRVHNHLTGKASYPIHTELLHSEAIKQTFKHFGTYLLPQAYPEGCPTHPAYPAGHAAIIGAGVTVLKAFFNEDFVIPNPVEATSDGSSLVAYKQDTLTIGGELNKLASNIALGRDTAGVHWRSDGIEGIRLGEAVAIEILKDYRRTYNEQFEGFTFTRFDGITITV